MKNKVNASLKATLSFAHCFGLMVLVICQAGNLEASESNKRGIDFTKYEINMKLPKNGNLLAGNFLGIDTKDIVLVSTTNSEGAKVHFFSFDDHDWKQTLEAEMGDDALFADTGIISGRERLVCYTGQGINQFNPISKNWTPMIKTEMPPLQTTKNSIPQLDFMQDLNGDDQDDMIILSQDETRIFLQSEDGSFKESLVSPYPARSKTDDSIGNRMEKIRQADWDMDHRIDLVFWDQGTFNVFLQNNKGTFNDEPLTYTNEVELNSDGSWSHELADQHDNLLTALLGFRKKTKQTALDSLRDLNGDGMIDLVTHSLEGRSLLRLKTSIGVHLGEQTPQGIKFPALPSSIVTPSGKQPKEYSTHHFDDLDGDGQLDLIIISVDAGIGDMLEAVTANTIDLDVEFYRMEKGTYPKKPTLKRRIAPKSKWFSRKGPFFPTVLTGDVNGDGLSDLVVGHHWDELRIYEGVPGYRLFSEEPRVFTVHVPANERNIRLIDLNQDEKKDILIHRSSPKTPHQINILISK